MRTAILALTIVIQVLVFSCKDSPETGPVKVFYGEDVCERCKMIISEEAFSAQYVLPGGKVRKFDDLGCMVHYMSEGGEGERDDIIAFYVKDYNSGGWIDGNRAYYIWNGNINTPMGHGIIALQDEKVARELADRENAKFLGGLRDADVWVLEKENK